MTISHMDTYKAINLIDTLLIRQLKRYTLHILVLVSISTLVVRLDCVVYFYDFIFFVVLVQGLFGLWAGAIAKRISAPTGDCMWMDVPIHVDA